MPTQVPARYELFNTQQTKNISIAVKIEGVPGLLTSRALFTRLRYGDPVLYGDPGLVYGGLRPLESFNGGSVRDVLSLDGSSLTISQRLEPEQGRASISTLSLAFIDKDQFMTQVISPGVVVDDILGKEITVFFGYAEISFPEDFFVIFRGRISGVQSASGIVTLQLSDPNIGRRQQIFFSAKTKLSAPISPSDTTINLTSNGDFHRSVLGPAGNYSSAVRLYLKVENEFIEYGPSNALPGAGFGTNQFTGVLRGQRGTAIASHPVNAEAQGFLEITDNAIEMALKLMLSGWSGSWESGVDLFSIVRTGDPSLLDQPGAIILPAKTDAVKDYGLTAGDFLTVSGAINPANNGTFVVQRFGDLFEEPNRIIYTNGALVAEESTPAVMAIRSQFDVYPKTCGSKLTPKDVDVDTHISLRNSFMGSSEYTLQFLLGSPESCKSFIESELFLPCGAYSLTKLGKLSIGLTKPPIADQSLIFLDSSNILDPANIRPERSINNRKFFNEITWEYDQSDSGAFRINERFLDTESLSIIKISSVLPIKSRGAKDALGFGSVVDRSSRFLLSRYKRGATIISLKVNWQVGNLIEAGDVIGIRDDGELQISNFATGERDLTTQLFEVVDRSLNIKEGNVSLKVISGVGTELTDRFATWAPSSLVAAGSTPSAIVFQDSFGAIYPGNEKKKWEDYIGEKVKIHNESYSVSEETTLLGFDPTNPYRMMVSGLSFTPAPGYIIDLGDYPNTTEKSDAQILKLIHLFWSPTVGVASGISQTQFTVSGLDISKFFVGGVIRVHSDDFLIDSGETLITITGVDTGTNTVTVDTALGFIPVAGQKVDLIGFPDQGAAYRWI